MCRRRRGRATEAWPLLQTPAVFEQHTTPCLKISRVESTTLVGSHLCPPRTKPLDAACRRIMLLADPPITYTCNLHNPPVLLRGAGWHARQANIGEQEER